MQGSPPCFRCGPMIAVHSRPKSAADLGRQRYLRIAGGKHAKAGTFRKGGALNLRGDPSATADRVHQLWCSTPPTFNTFCLGGRESIGHRSSADHRRGFDTAEVPARVRMCFSTLIRLTTSWFPQPGQVMVPVPFSAVSPSLSDSRDTFPHVPHSAVTADRRTSSPSGPSSPSSLRNKK